MKKDVIFTPDPYQVQGAAWLSQRKRALLADIMGVGKSGQAITAAEMLGAKRILVVCQAGRRLGWKSDFKRWAPHLPTHPARHKRYMRPLLYGVTIVSYDQANMMAAACREQNVRFDICIIDEVQYLKTPTAKRTQNVLGKDGIAHLCNYIWLLSGTPMLNHPGEMWTWLYTLFPNTILDERGKPMSYEAFTDRYCTKRVTRWGETFTGGKNMEELKARIAPIMLRRGEEVLQDLPPLDFEDMKLSLESIRGNPHIDQVLELEATQEVKDLVAHMLECEDGKDALLDEPIPFMARRFTPSPITMLRRWTSIVKAPALAEAVVKEIRQGGLHKIVIFAIHRDALQILERIFTHEGMDPVLVWGGTPPVKREKLITKFVSEHRCRVFLGQVQATGTGIDGLQHACNDVIFLETDWTPAGNLQAAKRLHRRGQRYPVRVRFAYLENSVDEIVNRVVRKKTKTLAEIFA